MIRDLQQFLLCLLISSTLTGLVTQGVKKLLDEGGKTWKANLLAAICAIVVSVAVGIGYCVIMSVPFSATIAVYFAALIVLSWLCAMVGYDKVMQTIRQLQQGQPPDAAA